MIARALTLVLLVAGLSLAQQTPTTFQAQSNLVLVPFHASRGNNYVSDLKRSEIVLLEDGHPREFSILEGPGITERRTPLELVLLFDTTSKSLGGLWNLKTIYDFTNRWTEAMSQATLEKGKADVRASVYHFDDRQLERLCQPTDDPKEFLSAIHRLLTPVSGDGAVTLELPPNRDLDPKSDPPKPWPMEAAIATMNDLAESPDKVLRMLVVFSAGIGGTTTAPEDVADQAIALGIPIYPVIINYQKMDNAAPFRNRPSGTTVEDGHRSEPGLQWMADYGRLGKLTGGRSFTPYDMNAAEVSGILEAVKNEGLSQYIVGFAPLPGQPREHKLEIKLTSKPSPKLIGGKRKVIY